MGAFVMVMRAHPREADVAEAACKSHHHTHVHTCHIITHMYTHVTSSHTADVAEAACKFFFFTSGRLTFRGRV